MALGGGPLPPAGRMRRVGRSGPAPRRRAPAERRGAARRRAGRARSTRRPPPTRTAGRRSPTALGRALPRSLSAACPPRLAEANAGRDSPPHCYRAAADGTAIRPHAADRRQRPRGPPPGRGLRGGGHARGGRDDRRPPRLGQPPHRVRDRPPARGRLPPVPVRGRARAPGPPQPLAADHGWRPAVPHHPSAPGLPPVPPSPEPPRARRDEEPDGRVAARAAADAPADGPAEAAAEGEAPGGRRRRAAAD